MIEQILEGCGANVQSIAIDLEKSLAKLPVITGGGADQVYLAPDTAKTFAKAEKIALSEKDQFVTVDRILEALCEYSETLKSHGITERKVGEIIKNLDRAKKPIVQMLKITIKF